MQQQVRLLIRQDPSVPAGGHALLFLQGAGRAPSGTALVIRRRQPPEAYLTASGWQQTPGEIAAESLERGEDGTPVFRLGPAVVDRIDPHAKVEIQIPSLGLGQLVVWPVLHQSSLGTLPTGAYVAGGTAPRLRPPGGIKPPEPRLRPPAPPEEPPPVEAATPAAPEPEAPPPTLSAPERDPVVAPPPRRRRAWPWILLGLLVMVAAGLGLWQYRDRGPEKLLCEWGLLDCVTDPCPAIAGQSVRQRADCYLANLEAVEAFARAEALGESDRDLAWALFDALGGRGYAPALLELGLCYDPLLPEGCSLKPRLASNARQALEHYRRAAEAGAAEAAAPQAALCSWLAGQSDLQSQAARQSYCQ